MLSSNASWFVVLLPWLVVLGVFGNDLTRLANALLNYVFG